VAKSDIDDCLVFNQNGLLTTSLGGVTLCYKFDQSRVQNKTALQYVKNHANWFRHCEDMDSQTYWPQFFLHFCILVIDCLTIFM